MRDAVPVEKRVAVSLWRLATGECYRWCGLMIGLAKPTVVKCCHEFVEAICRLQGVFIKFPSTRAEIGRKIEGFSEKNKCCCDWWQPYSYKGTKRESRRGLLQPETFLQFFSARNCWLFGTILSVATGFPGSLHDSRMLRLSDVYWAAEEEDILIEPTVDLGGTVIRPLVVGDSAYPLKTWLLPVIKDKWRP